ncbi:MAG: response regulator [Lachnospiraceae bacterium]|nr:response regulator [Lachnospiraceae bacterium]
MHDDKKLLLIGEQKNYLLLSVREQLDNSNLDTVLVSANIGSISGVTENIKGLLIYAEEDILKDQQLLGYIKNRAQEEKWPIFLIGYPDELEILESAFSKQLIQLEFLRPLNVKEMVSAIHEYYDRSLKVKKKILVVDDSGTTLRSIKEWLDEEYQVVLAVSGIMALKYLAVEKPDLVLLDYEMPVCNGKQVLEMIRSEVDYADIPVIFLTAKGDRESVLNVMGLKPDGYLLKNQEPSAIVDAIKEFFEKQKAKNDKIG